MERFVEVSLDLNQWAELTEGRGELMDRLKAIERQLSENERSVIYLTETLAEVISELSLNMARVLKQR